MKLQLGIIALILLVAFPYTANGQPERISLLPENANAKFAAWSPDGKWIAFSIIGKPPTYAPSGLYIVSPDGKKTLAITQGITPGDFVYYPDWSPDSNYIKFAAGPAGGADQGFIASVDGHVISQYEPDLSEVLFNPWRSDSQAYFKVDESSSRLVAVGLDGNQFMQSTETLNFGTVPELSPDGNLLVAETEHGIALINAETLHTTAKLLEGEPVNGVNWSPDGKTLLAFVLNPDSISGKALLLDIFGKQKMSFDVTSSLFNIQWSPDSKILAALNKPGKNSKVDVTFINIDGTILGRAATGSEFTDWAPNNTYMALTPTGDLVALNPDGSVVHDFAFKANQVDSAYAPPATSWSPNGQLLALAPSPSDPCCANELRIYNANGSLLHTLLRSGDEVSRGGFYWSPDNTSIVLVSEVDGTWLVRLS